MLKLIFFLTKAIIAFCVFSIVFFIYPINSTLEPFRTCDILFSKFAVANEVEYISIIAEVHLLPFKLALKLNAFDPSFLGFPNSFSMCRSNVPIFASGALWYFLFWIAGISLNFVESCSKTRNLPKKQNGLRRKKIIEPSISVDFSNKLALIHVESGFTATGYISEHRKRQFENNVSKFLSVYPVKLVEKCLTRMVVSYNLQNNGVTIAGMASSARREIVISANDQNIRHSLSTMHHEFAHLIVREFPFNIGAWLALEQEAEINYEFKMAGPHTSQCGKNSKENLEYFLKNGFLHEYATTCFEEDFCAFADHLLYDPAKLASFQKYKLIRLKTSLIVDYYSKLGVQLPREFLS